MFGEGSKHHLSLCRAQRKTIGGELNEVLQRSANAQVGPLDLWEHLLEQLFIQRLLPRDAESLGVGCVLLDLIDDAVGKWGDDVELIPEGEQEVPIRLPRELLFKL